MDEKKLIELAKKNNQNALSILLSDNYDIVYGYLIKLCYDNELAKDLTQETMMKAIVNLSKFKLKSKFSTWLIAIATNLYKNHAKKNNKITFTDDLSMMDCMLKSHQLLEDDFIIKDQFIKVMKILKTMKDQQRMPFILCHYYGYKYDEISVILKCPVGTVRSRIHNTIKKIQTEMKGDCYEDM